MFRRLGSRSRLGRLGIALLILSLARVPVPVPDFIGSSDGEVVDGSCLNSDNSADQLSTRSPRRTPGLFWRWVVINTASLCGSSSSIGSDAASCHPDWTSCQHDPSPQFLHTRTVPRVANPLVIPSIDDLRASLAWRSGASPRPILALLARNYHGTFPDRTCLSSLLSRWNC